MNDMQRKRESAARAREARTRAVNRRMAERLRRHGWVAAEVTGEALHTRVILELRGTLASIDHLITAGEPGSNAQGAWQDAHDNLTRALHTITTEVTGAG